MVVGTIYPYNKCDSCQCVATIQDYKWKWQNRFATISKKYCPPLLQSFQQSHYKDNPHLTNHLVRSQRLYYSILLMVIFIKETATLFESVPNISIIINDVFFMSMYVFLLNVYLVTDCMHFYVQYCYWLCTNLFNIFYTDCTSVPGWLHLFFKPNLRNVYYFYI